MTAPFAPFTRCGSSRAATSRSTATDLPLGPAGPPRVCVGGVPARVRAASSPPPSRHRSRPSTRAASRPIRDRAGRSRCRRTCTSRATLATGRPPGGQPGLRRPGRLYVTHSGTRGIKVPVPLFRVRADGGTRAVAVDIAEPHVDGARAGRRAVRVEPVRGARLSVTTDDRVEVYATELGVPTGLAFGADGTLFVGDRSGSIFRVSPDGASRRSRRCRRAWRRFIWRSGPTTGSVRHGADAGVARRVYRITPDRLVDVVCDGFGRPQGLAFDQRRAAAMSSTRWRAPPGSIASTCRRRRRRPELLVLGADAGRRGVRSRRRAGRRVERHACGGSTCRSRRSRPRHDRREPHADLPRQADRRRRIARLRGGRPALQRVLGAGDLVMLAIGAVIGAGIFGAIGTAAAGQMLPNGEVVRYGAGPALVLSFLLLGGACALAALCYAELASMIPQAGSAYAYAYATLGELVAWIIGWDLILEYAVGNVAVAISWGDYFKSLLAASASPCPTGSRPATGRRCSARTRDVHGLLDTAPRCWACPSSSTCRRSRIVLGITWLLLRGARESARANASWSSSSSLALALFVGVGVVQHRPGELHAVRAERLHGHSSGRGDRVLRLHRLRRHLDGGRGDDRPAAEPADAASSAGWRSAR